VHHKQNGGAFRAERIPRAIFGEVNSKVSLVKAYIRIFPVVWWRSEPSLKNFRGRRVNFCVYTSRAKMLSRSRSFVRRFQILFKGLAYPDPTLLRQVQESDFQRSEPLGTT